MWQNTEYDRVVDSNRCLFTHLHHFTDWRAGEAVDDLSVQQNLSCSVVADARHLQHDTQVKYSDKNKWAGR